MSDTELLNAIAKERIIKRKRKERIIDFVISSAIKLTSFALIFYVLFFVGLE